MNTLKPNTCMPPCSYKGGVTVRRLRTFSRCCCCAWSCSSSRRLVRRSRRAAVLSRRPPVTSALAPAGRLLFTHTHGTKLLTSTARIDCGRASHTVPGRTHCDSRAVLVSMTLLSLRIFRRNDTECATFSFFFLLLRLFSNFLLPLVSMVTQTRNF